MKNRTFICAALFAGLLAAGLVSPAVAAEKQNKLEAQAKITRAAAEKIALTQAPNGTVKEGELEEENGRLIWSFDIATPGAKNITEVQVDARTGKIVATEKESPADQEKEKKEKPLAAKPDAWTPTLAPVDEPFTNIGRNAYFILEPGRQLVYAGKEGGKPTELTITVLDETREIDGVVTRVVEEREVAGGKLAEVSRNFFALGTKTSNLYYFGEDVDIYKGDKVVHEGAWHAGEGGAKHGILIPGAIKIGERYYQEQAPGVAMDRAENVSTTQTVKTPAGVFEHCLKTKETTPLERGTEYKWYAPGVGLVQDGDLKLVKQGFVKPGR
jgi:hypothetical protein